MFARMITRQRAAEQSRPTPFARAVSATALTDEEY
jgi:hypothetical protein